MSEEHALDSQCIGASLTLLRVAAENLIKRAYTACRVWQAGKKRTYLAGLSGLGRRGEQQHMNCIQDHPHNRSTVLLLMQWRQPAGKLDLLCCTCPAAQAHPGPTGAHGRVIETKLANCLGLCPIIMLTARARQYEDVHSTVLGS